MKRGPTEQSLRDSSSSGLKKPAIAHDKLRILQDHFDLGVAIASGTAGTVHKATPKGHHHPLPTGGGCVAVKHYKKRGDYWEREVQNELECVKRIMPHPHILGYIEVFTSPDRDDVYVAMEWVAFDMAGIMRLRGTTMALGEVKGYMKQLLLGVAHIHAAGIMHRDLKPENILITHDNVVKLADFGICQSVTRASGSPYHTNMVTTQWYRAPELLLWAHGKDKTVRKSRYDTAIDMWSVGCIMGEFMLGGHTPVFFSKADDPKRHLQIIYELCGTPLVINEWAEELRPLLAESFRAPMASKLHKDFGLVAQSKRPAFFSPSAMSALAAMLCLNPRGRATAKHVLAMPFFALDSPLPYPPHVIKRLGSGVSGHGRDQK